MGTRAHSKSTDPADPPASADRPDKPPITRERKRKLIDVGVDLPDAGEDRENAIDERIRSPDSAYGLWLVELSLEERPPAYQRALKLEAAHRGLLEENGLTRAAVIAWVLHWTLLFGVAPEERHVHAQFAVEDIARMFDDYEGLHSACALADTDMAELAAELEQRLEEAIEASEELEAARQQVSRERGALERERKQIADLNRRRETAERKRTEAQGQRDAARAAERKLERTIAALAEQVEALKSEMAAGGADQEALEPQHVRELHAKAEKLGAKLEVAAASHAATRSERDAARAERDRLQGDVAAHNRTAAELRARLRALESGTDPVIEEPPRTVAEATARAARHARNLVFSQRARETAADSPFRRPDDIYEAFMRLDELAADYLSGATGVRTADRARELGLNWRAAVSQTAIARARSDYQFRHAGRDWLMREHVVVGNGSGAGLCARIYLHFHPGDADYERAVLVGAVGRHLPDSTG